MTQFDRICIVALLILFAILSVVAALLIDSVVDKEEYGKVLAAPKATCVSQIPNNDPQVAPSNSNNIPDPIQAIRNNSAPSGMAIQRPKSIGEDRIDKDHGKGKGDSK